MMSRVSRLDLCFGTAADQTRQKTQEALDRAFAGDLEQWRTHLSSSPYADGFEFLYGYENEELALVITDSEGKPSIDWLVELSRKMKVPQRDYSDVERVLLELWLTLKRKVTLLLQVRAGHLPDRGYVLYFSEGITWCIVLSYRFAGNAADVEVVHCISEPQAVYDIFALMHLADEHTRAILKDVIRSPSKVIAHRGVLIDVDRYLESRVFGPSIDTIYLNEVLTKLLIEPGYSGKYNFKIERALDIGCGNGMLIAGLAERCRSMKFMVAIDTDIQAIQCTIRNTNYVINNGNHGCRFLAIYGPYSGTLLQEKFDLAVSNPPYLPHPNSKGGYSRYSQGHAIIGPDLVEEIVNTSPQYLAPNGALLIVFSNLAESELQANVPDNMEYISLNKSDGFRVLFDLEDVADDPEWLRFLKNRGLEYDSDSGTYYHYLKVGAIVNAKSEHRNMMSLDAYLTNIGSKIK